MRWLVLAIPLAFVGCKKHKAVEDAAVVEPGPPKVGHSVTKLKDAGEEEGSGGSGSATADHSGGIGSDELADAKLYGGNGKAAFRDDMGHVHGPGGPIFMGHGPDCDDTRDHCMRPDTWFSVGNLVSGQLFRAVPVFELENKWWNWRGDEAEDVGKLLKTELLGDNVPRVGDPIVFFASDISARPWMVSEYDALTSSMWDAGYVDRVTPGSKTLLVKGWNDVVKFNAVRRILEQKKP